MSLEFRVRGAYLESCNCEAVCPCRMVGGIRGGRSTYGVCFGILTWRIDEGRVGEHDVSGLCAALDFRYDDDEDGSPWTVTLHVDSRGTDAQQTALAAVFLDELSLPWITKPRHLIGVETSEIVLADGDVRVGDSVRLKATMPVEVDAPVACGIPGYDRPGRELYADVLRVQGFALSGNCAFATDFEYLSA